MSSVTPPPSEPALPPDSSALPVCKDSLPPARFQAARAIDVLRRTVRFGLRNAERGPRPRFLHATCGPWLAMVPEEQLEPGEIEALGALRRTLEGAEASDAASVELLRELDRGLVAFEGLLGSLEQVALEPRVALLPSGERERAAESRQRQVELEERRKAREALPVVQLPESDEAPAPIESPAEDPATADELDVAGPASDAEASGEDGSQAEPRRERRRRKSGGSRKRDKREKHEEEVQEVAAPEPPPPKPKPKFRAIDDPKGAGQAIEAFFPQLPRPLVKALGKQGIATVAELLLQPPLDYELLPRAVEPSEALPTGERQVLRGTVIRRLTRLSAIGRRHEVVLGDEQAQLVCRWVTPRDEAFWAAMAPGSRVALHGTVELDGEDARLIEAEPVWVDSRGQGRQARYGLEGISDEQLRGLLRQAVDAFADHLLDPLPEGDRKRLRLLDLGEALRRLHFPVHGARRGRERMAFDELLLYQLGHSLGGSRRPQERGSAHTIHHRLVAQIMSTRSQPLSDGQEIAFSDIRRDLARPRPMNRLLQGDVGVGKGFVALLSAIVVAEGREQVVFIAPDAIAAEHRFLFAEPVLRSVGLMPALLLDKPDAAQTDALKRGEVHVVFTTSAITKAWPGFRRLGLVVVEEREEYGTVSSRNLPSQGVRPDLLVLTDAPIPTSIALTVFGDMDLSLVPGQHVTGLQVTSHPWSEHMEAYAKARAELEAGRQVYVVLPMIGGQERLNQRELARFADALRGDAFPGARIGVFSKVQSREERHRTYEDFRHRRIDVLLTTTIIEDGPAVHNATATVVLEADRFDLVRLHRLRAHVARGVRPGRCMFVLSEQPDPEGVRRVELMVGENDAFRIAELDLAQRGAEALLGERAQELPRFRYMDPLEHRDLLVRARAEAFDILAKSPGLGSDAHSHLRAALEQSWKGWFPGSPSLGKKPPSVRGRSGRRRRRRSRSR
jgi:ATP-dependent DNA helicase RecG